MRNKLFLCILKNKILACKKNCPKCRGKHTKKYWKNSDWKQKYKCKKCSYCFVISQKQTPKIYGEKVFEDWIEEGYSCRQLWLQKHKNSKDILKNIQKHLDSNELYQIDLVFENIHHIMIDGIWISKDICLIIYYEYIQKKVIRFGFYSGELYEDIVDDLRVLRDEFKYDIQSFTVDGGKQIKKAVEEVYPESIFQRCLTHIHRQVWNYISKNPQSDCWKDLQKIVTFQNFENEERFKRYFQKWEKKYFDFLKEKSSNWKRTWYTHRRLRQARSHIKNALPYMFHYLENSNIKRSSNDLEWYNWVLSDHIYMHRWLKKERLISFVSLWIYNRNLKEK